MLNTLVSRLTSEKIKLEEHLSFEVKEKQELVMALAKEKKNLTTEFQTILHEIKKNKHRIKKHVDVSRIKGHPHYGTPSTPKASF
jgi:hypothetical protein